MKNLTVAGFDSLGYSPAMLEQMEAQGVGQGVNSGYVGSLTVSPIATLATDPDGGIAMLMAAAKVQFIDSTLLQSIRDIAVDAAKDPSLTLNDLVDRWIDAPGAATNGMRDFGNSVAYAYMIK